MLVITGTANFGSANPVELENTRRNQNITFLITRHTFECKLSFFKFWMVIEQIAVLITLKTGMQSRIFYFLRGVRCRLLESKPVSAAAPAPSKMSQRFRLRSDSGKWSGSSSSSPALNPCSRDNFARLRCRLAI